MTPACSATSHMFLGYFERDIGPAITLADRSLELNPSFALGWLRSGWLRLWSGQTAVGIAHIDKALRLNPHGKAPANFARGVAHFFERRLEKAASMLLLSLDKSPNWAPAHRFLASCYAHMGRLSDAAEVVATLRKITPVIIPSSEHWRILEDREFFLEGLRRAAA